MDGRTQMPKRTEAEIERYSRRYSRTITTIYSNFYNISNSSSFSLG